MIDPFFARALEVRAEAREAFEDYRLAQYARAEEECRGSMLNSKGRSAGMDALDLFMGNEATAQAYASPELSEWWRNNGRPTFARFAAAWPID